MKVDERIEKLEDSLHKLEVDIADRFATIMAQLSNLIEGQGKVIEGMEDIKKENKDNEVKMATVELRLGNAEESIKSFHSKMWAGVIAIIGTIGSAIGAWFQFKS